MSKFCAHCGKEVNEKAVVCIHCGCAVSSIGQHKKGGNGTASVGFGIFMLIMGVLSAIFGSAMNNDVDLQMEALFEHGTTNPGDPFVYIGVVVATIGLILFITGLAKSRRD